MDAVTHTMMGAILASPWAPEHPEAAACFVLGSILPDADALSRTFGKRAFLRFHQTVTHSLAAVAAIGAASAALFLAMGHPQWLVLAPALSGGMLLHVLLDATNTYGITLWAPFSARRVCTEWVFFIDLPVIVASIAALVAIYVRWQTVSVVGWQPAVWYAGGVVLYGLVRVWLSRRAWRLAPPDTLTLIPSGAVPWRFLGSTCHGDRARLFTLNALQGEVAGNDELELFDDAYSQSLADVPEFRLMRDLSPAYHVVKAAANRQSTRLTCRDLRIRNFNTRFGSLEIDLGADGQIDRVDFQV